MEKDNFLNIIENQTLLNSKSEYDLKQLLTEYPYFQSAAILYLLNLKKLKQADYEAQLQKYTILIPDKEIFIQNIDNLLNFDLTHKFQLTSDSNKKSISDIEDDKNLLIKEKKSEELASDLTNETEIFTLSDDSINTTSEIPNENELPESQTIPETTLLELDTFSSVEKEIETDQTHDTENLTEDTEPKDTKAFTSWFEYPNYSLEEEKTQSNKAENQSPYNELIDKFILEEPRIIPDKKDHEEIHEFSDENNIDSDEFITETLAKIYIKQSHYDKAIIIYEKLSLKYPEKNTYFAAQIEVIKNLSNKL